MDDVLRALPDRGDGGRERGPGGRHPYAAHRHRLFSGRRGTALHLRGSLPGDARVIYFDNAATTRSKPPQVVAAMTRFLTEVGANPGRSGHRLSTEAARVVYRAREAVAELLGVSDPLRVIFCANATHALNLAICGLVEPGRHVVTTSMEHNSVMRPIRALKARGTAVTVVPCSPEGTLDPAAVEQALRPETTLIVMTQASNVVGTILPVQEVAAIARAHGVLLLVDGAQSAGALPISLSDLGADLFAFTGHKALYGPTGTGGLVVGERVAPGRLQPLMRGGTGSDSESEMQPDFFPDAFEAGTVNVVGLAGLEAAVRWLLEQNVDSMRSREEDLLTRLVEGLGEIPGVELYGPRDASRRLPVVSFTIAGVDPAEIGLRLDEEFDIAARIGLHCAPAAHKTLGTFPTGTVRLSLGAFNTAAEVDLVIQAVCEIARDAPAVPGGRR
ncbi:MAG: aminotransferase class V-fold PLP-dependent enzyme [Thermoleophilia bacterium]|nr:aminotransferase class V-fold PLP-dependent enzyme [Thermoleophilia bacterium]